MDVCRHASLCVYVCLRLYMCISLYVMWCSQCDIWFNGIYFVMYRTVLKFNLHVMCTCVCAHVCMTCMSSAQRFLHTYNNIISYIYIYMWNIKIIPGLMVRRVRRLGWISGEGPGNGIFSLLAVAHGSNYHLISSSKK